MMLSGVSVSGIPILILLLAAVFLGALLSLSGVALGALAVFKTKREPHEGLFRVGRESGDAFVVDDFAEGYLEQAQGWRRTKEAPVGSSSSGDVVPDIIAKQTERFLQQLREQKAKSSIAA